MIESSNAPSDQLNPLIQHRDFSIVVCLPTLSVLSLVRGDRKLSLLAKD